MTSGQFARKWRQFSTGTIDRRFIWNLDSKRSNEENII